jgi:hypothetical protein
VAMLHARPRPPPFPLHHHHGSTGDLSITPALQVEADNNNWDISTNCMPCVLQDALPIEEPGDLVAGRMGFRSTVPDTAHMCGHDSHMSMLLGAARWVTSICVIC